MYNQLGPSAATGLVALGTGSMMDGVFATLFLIVAAFTLLCAGGALMRTMPAFAFMYRTPKRLAPSKHENRKPRYRR